MKHIVKRVLSWLLMKVVASDIENATLMDCKGRFIKPFHPECKDIYNGLKNQDKFSA